MSEAARSRRDDPRYEPQLAVPGREATPHDAGAADPLAELARLVGQADPYRNVFRPAAAPAQDAVYPTEAYAHDGYGDHHAPQHGDEAYHGYDHGHAPADADRGGDEAHGHDPYATHDHPYDDAYYAAEQGAHTDEAGLADERLAPDLAAAAVLPDMWARDEGHATGVTPQVDADRAPAGGDASGTSSARRPVAVLAAVLLLTGGGLAASFLAKSPSTPGATAAAGREAPTILAATGPTKVKVADPSATAPEDQDAALLSKSGTVSSGPVKIVSSQEQPADLGQLPKSDLADGARPLPQASPSPFPEPKKVKTFLVRPDGTMLSADGVPAPSGTAADALAATPKTAARGGGATPKSTATPAAPVAPPSIASLSADPAPAGASPPVSAADAAAAKPGRQPASAGARVASATPTDTADTPAATGSYGVQLASSPIEADANAAFAKLKKKYPALLGSRSATVHKAETGDKPVYRVRVGGMSQDDAKSLCAQLQSAGGSCFVMHN